MNGTERASEPARGRLVSLDAYRGFVMMAILVGPLILGVASALDEHLVFRAIATQFEHAEWEGCRLWDLIMPSFMMMVGLSLPWSHASRVRRGESEWRIRGHVVQRCIVLIFLGLLVSSAGRTETRFMFQGLLTQFGLAYGWAFLMVGRGLRVQCLTAALILIADWLAFVLYPAPPAGFVFHAAGIPDVTPFQGLFAHWNRGTSLAADFDLWLLNRFPRAEPYVFEPGGHTLNFIPSIVTMTIGVIAGEMLRSPRTQREKLAWLFRWGAVLLGAGIVAGLTVCPLVKQLWTPSWVLFSGGVSLLTMGAYFWAVELKGWSKACFPLVVVGMNSIAIYLLIMITKAWLLDMIRIHLVSSWAGQEFLADVLLWLTCYWMYRRGIFLRI